MNKKIIPHIYYRIMLLTCWLLLGLTQILAQHPSSELDDILRKDAARNREKASLDSVLTHLKNRWEIKISMGRLFFSPETRSLQEEPFFLPDHLFLTRLGAAWHFGERWQAELGIGFHINRNIPPTPGIFSVLGGENIQVEGSGALLMPIDFGVRYALSKGRFRPLMGFSLGTIVGNERYITVEGNIQDGFNQTEKGTRGNAPYAKLGGGMDYRLAKGLQSHFMLTYTQSKEFDQTLGGYQAYQGIAFLLGISIIPF